MIEYSKPPYTIIVLNYSIMIKKQGILFILGLFSETYNSYSDKNFLPLLRYQRIFFIGI
jgi:hypothetical protein